MFYNLRIYIFLNFFLVLSIIQISCNKKELSFHVNPSLLEKTFDSVELAIKLRIPKGWNSISKKEYLQIKNKLSKNFQIKITPLEIYLNKKNGNSCIISKFDKDKNIKYIIKDYKEKLNKYYSNSEIRFGVFYSKKIKFYQFKLTSKNFINFKLIFYNKYKEIIQIDYITSFKNYEKELHSIESSIGSIEKL